MIQKVLSGIGGVDVYGVLSVVIFFAVFLGILVWTVGLKRSYLDTMSRLPLEDHPDLEPDSDRTSNPDSRYE